MQWYSTVQRYSAGVQVVEGSQTGEKEEKEEKEESRSICVRIWRGFTHTNRLLRNSFKYICRYQKN